MTKSSTCFHTCAALGNFVFMMDVQESGFRRCGLCEIERVYFCCDRKSGAAAPHSILVVPVGELRRRYCSGAAAESGELCGSAVAGGAALRRAENEKGEKCSRTLAWIKYSTPQRSEVEARVVGEFGKITRQPSREIHHRGHRARGDGASRLQDAGCGVTNRTAVRTRAGVRTRPARQPCDKSFLCGVAQTFYDV